ncbi:hypothetical protein H4R20_007114 [Coemansia guatemalensis]|uniref:Uncharacterized protein n=1 Tax=Coemansia guatemalensis TaxID=2761395 RepID=A0A9W8HN43_9FUNG|nr:hypothetical protein H4R20_007114 [Coemansia guatemalensis]
MAINHKPNDVSAFAPASISMTAPAPNPAAYRGPEADYHGMIGVQQHNAVRADISRGSAESTTVADPSSELLAELLTPLKTVLTRLLYGIEGRLDNASAENLAGMLRGPIGSLKQYLISIWPTTPLAPDSPPHAQPMATHST